MRNDFNTVFILGAGASHEAKVPLMRDFLDVAMRLAPSRHDAEAFALVRKARSKLQLAQSKAQLNIRNVESVFAAFEMAELFGRLGDLESEEVAGLTQAMRAVIVHTIEHYMEVRVQDGWLLPPAPYGEFGALVKSLQERNHKVSVITFNYDLGIDMGLWLNQISPDYCLPTGQPDPSLTELMKLHGSINWAHCAKCARIWPHRIDKIVANAEDKWPSVIKEPRDKAKIVRLRVGETLSLIKCQCGEHYGTEALIVPPTANKYGLHRQLNTVWQRASERLSEADNIFVIGYSWPQGDHFFHQLYALGTIGDTILSRFWVFNPDEEVRRKFDRELLGEQARDCFGPTNAPVAVGTEADYTFRHALHAIAGTFHLGRLKAPSRGNDGNLKTYRPSSPWT